MKRLDRVKAHARIQKKDTEQYGGEHTLLYKKEI